MQELHLNIPISKIDEEQRMVYGYATTEAVDSQNDIVDYEASKAAFASWLGNIREMHNPIAVGKAIDIQYDDAEKRVLIGAKISESADGQNAWQKVKEGILTGFSIGGKISKVVKEVAKKDGQEVDVTRITDYSLSEVSLVDNPANPQAQLVMVKSMDGNLQRVEAEVTPTKKFDEPWWRQQYMLPMEKAQALYDNSMNKKDYTSDQRQAMADSGQALPDGSYPIKTVQDLKNAIQSYGRAKNKAQVKAHIIKRAKALGRTDLLPEDWNVKSTITEELRKSVCDASWLASLASSLVAYIQMEAQEGDQDVEALKGALKVIQTAIADEVTEGDDFEPSDGLYDAVLLAQSASNLTKGSAMSKEDITKGVDTADDKVDEAAAVAGGDESAEVVADAAADETQVDETAADEVNAEAPAEGDEAAGADAEAEGKASDEEAEGEKATSISDLKKSIDTFAAKIGSDADAKLQKALGEFTDKVEKSMTDLADRVKKLEDQPAISKAKASYVDVTKGDEKAEVDPELADLLKRQEELLTDPNAGTPAERGQLAAKLRKFQLQGKLTA